MEGSPDIHDDFVYLLLPGVGGRSKYGPEEVEEFARYPWILNERIRQRGTAVHCTDLEGIASETTENIYLAPVKPGSNDEGIQGIADRIARAGSQ